MCTEIVNQARSEENEHTYDDLRAKCRDALLFFVKYFFCTN